MTIANKLDSSDPNRCGRSIKYALEHLTLGLDSDEKPYAVINGQPKSNPIAHPLEGKTIKTWIRKKALNRGDLLKRDDIKAVIETLFAHASAIEIIMDIHLRVATSKHGGVVFDLRDKQTKRVLM